MTEGGAAPVLGIARNWRQFSLLVAVNAHLPPGEVRPGDLPFLARAIRCEDEGALASPGQYTHASHDRLL